MNFMPVGASMAEGKRLLELKLMQCHMTQSHCCGVKWMRVR
eukprot:CAMPEP_0172628432 /NCGR_PEP_ID=MMETSP1068-20121228/161793_1 /TAXON_ID=35684 /ORGANISM="Pseudopedinella elastica, Strain CCMP716" /LENGTH=40 /DNA_ID= /DNA_START= /DNA_END= /DNA_ORIENTATION=